METLRLRADCAEQLVLATEQELMALNKLQHLLIESPEAAGGNTMFAPMLAWLLSRAFRLQLLSANLGNVSYFPPMSLLKHLVLNLTSFPGNDSIFDSLSHAVSLETLMIDCGQVGPGPGPRPSLKLENLTSLERLALKYVLPADLQVREGCSVLVEGTAACTSHNIWSRVAENISYLRVEDKSSELLGVPASFAGFLNLQVVYFAIGGLGKEGANVSLHNGLANVRRLCIIGDNLFITVPAKVQWEEVWFHSHKAVCITLVDVDAFVAKCRRFATCYKSLIGTWMPILCKCLAAQGLEFRVKDRENSMSLLARGKLNFVRCFCGACLKCLAPSQKALSDWATR